jgi:Domain of unknown function (DUF6429)
MHSTGGQFDLPGGVAPSSKFTVHLPRRPTSSRGLDALIDSGKRAKGKGQHWQSLDRLFEKGYIVDPKTKARSVLLTDAAKEKARALFHRQFGLGERDGKPQETVSYGYQLGLVRITPPGYIPR